MAARWAWRAVSAPTPDYALSARPDRAAEVATAGSLVTYTLSLRNTGRQADTYTLKTLTATWQTQILDPVTTQPLERLTLNTCEARDILVRHCGECHGAGTAPDTQVVTCTMCGGRGEVQSVQRSFLGQVMTSRPCPQCQGFGTLIPHPCPECSGEGRVRTRRTITVKIPAGVDTGTRIQLSGEGEVGPGAGPAGDLFLEIVEQPHETFTRQGDDLHCTISLPMTAAALGTTIDLTTLDGVEKIDVKAGTQSGSVVTLRQKGVTHLRSSGRGDLHVHVDVITPSKLDERQEALLRELAALRGEERPAGTVQTNHSGGGLFSRLKDAFNNG